MALKAVTRAMQYCSNELFGIRDLCRKQGVKLTVDKTVFDTIRDLVLRKTRGCRGGVRLQREIKSLVKPRTLSNSPLNIVDRRILKPLMCIDDQVKNIETVVSARSKELPSSQINHQNLIEVKTEKHVDNGANSHGAKMRELLYSLNLDQHVHGPTHIHGHTLDLVITRSSEAVVQSLEVHAPSLSDHCPLTFTIATKKPPSERRLITYRKVNKINIDAFKQDICESELVKNSLPDTIDGVLKVYNDSLSHILEKHAPLRTKYVTVRPAAPWYTADVEEAKRCKRRAERRYLKSRLAVDLQIPKDERLKLNAMCKKAKQEYYRGKINDCAKDQKSLSSSQMSFCIGKGMEACQIMMTQMCWQIHLLPFLWIK